MFWGVSWKPLGAIENVIKMCLRRPKMAYVGNLATRRLKTEPGGFCAGLVEPQNAQDGPKIFPRCYQDAYRRFMLETPLGERIERASAASEARGAIRMDAVSCRVEAVQTMLSGFVKVTEENLFNTRPRESSFSTHPTCSCLHQVS